MADIEAIAVTAEANRRIQKWRDAGDVSAWLNLNLLNLTKLPPLPDTVRKLNCSDNRLTKLPDNLPRDMQKLYCDSNQLTELSFLSDTVRELYCGNNRLIKLPDRLPHYLQILYCGDNQLIELPIIPMTLIHIHCIGNTGLIAPPYDICASFNIYAIREWQAANPIPTVKAVSRR